MDGWGLNININTKVNAGKDPLEILQFEFKGNPQHHQTNGSIDDQQALGVEIELNLVYYTRFHTKISFFTRFF